MSVELWPKVQTYVLKIISSFSRLVIVTYIFKHFVSSLWIYYFNEYNKDVFLFIHMQLLHIKKTKRRKADATGFFCQTLLFFSLINNQTVNEIWSYICGFSFALLSVHWTMKKEPYIFKYSPSLTFSGTARLPVAFYGSTLKDLSVELFLFKGSIINNNFLSSNIPLKIS